MVALQVMVWEPQVEALRAGRAIPTLQRRQTKAGWVPRTLQSRWAAKTVLQNCQRRQTTAWELQSAGSAHLSLQQDQMEGQKVLGPLAECVVDQVAESMAEQMAEQMTQERSNGGEGTISFSTRELELVVKQKPPPPHPATS